MEKVSIVLTIFNGEDFVRRSLNNLLNQTYDNIEIIVVNDGSTDDTKEKLDEFSTIKNLNIYNLHHVGRAEALNYGINHSSGEIIAIADVDDLYSEKRIEKQVKVMQEGYGIVGSYCTFKNIQKNITSQLKVPLSDSEIKKCIIYNNTIPHTSLCFRKELFEYHNYEDFGFKDYLFISKILKHTKAKNIGESLCDIYIRENSVMQSGSILNNLKKSFFTRKKIHEYYNVNWIKSFFINFLLLIKLLIKNVNKKYGV